MFTEKKFNGINQNQINIKKTMQRRIKQNFAALMLFVTIFLSACGGDSSVYADQKAGTADSHAEQNLISQSEGCSNQSDLGVSSGTDTVIYSGSAFEYRNNNVPGFSEEELTTEAFERYSELDSLGRCGVAYANICTELMPTEERENIGMIKPTGWQTVKYQGLVDGNYLYNRCHLIGFQLAGENANEKNLITGTRFMNVDGMLPFENQVADFVKSTGYHVLYRVTPVFVGNELVARGVIMEAKSVEDKGAGLSFNVYVYNVQPGVIINYADGTSVQDKNFDPLKFEQEKNNLLNEGEGSARYVLNTNSNKFHYPDCSSVKRIKPENRKETSLSREILTERGFSPCGVCNP